MWPSSGASTSPDADDAPPADKRALTHSGTHTERGKPVALPHEAPSYDEVDVRESEPQGEPAELRVWEDGESECRSVIERIEVERSITRATSPHAKAGRLPSGVSSRESLTNRLRREGR